MYIYVYVYVYVYLYLYIYTYLCIFVYIYIYLHRFVHPRIARSLFFFGQHVSPARLPDLLEADTDHDEHALQRRVRVAEATLGNHGETGHGTPVEGFIAPHGSSGWWFGCHF